MVASVLLVALALAAQPALADQGGTGPATTPAPPAAQQPGRAVLNPVGVILALVFVFLMVNLFRWMFRVPPQVPYSVVKARQSVSALHRILVPTSDAAFERAVELACRLGGAQKAEIILAYVIEVPFTLSLDAAVPAEEAKGQEALRTARFIVEQHGLAAKPILIPHRTIWSGMLRVANEQMVDAIVMNVGGGRAGQPEGIGATAEQILKRAQCEVILDKRPFWPVPSGASL